MGLLALGAVVAFLLMPILAFIRSMRLESEMQQLRQRLDALERRQAASAGTQPSVEPSPMSVTAPAAPSPLAPSHPAPSHLAPSHPAPSHPAPSHPAPSHPAPSHPAPSHLAPSPALDLEEQIGGRWLQHAGLIVLVLGIAFFLRYAFERDWLSPAVRVALGGVAGIGLGAGGLRLSRTYRPYGLLLAGGGIAVLYLSVYAALNLYELFAPPLAFSLFVLITVGAAAVADRTDSLGLAIVAVAGGFATPFLVGGDRDQQAILFTYVGLLIAATTYLAHRRTWPWLNVVSLLLTAVVVLSWAATFYTPDKYLRTELFLTAYCAMFVDVLRKAWPARLVEEAARPPADPLTLSDTRLVFLLLLAPVSYHLWSVIALSPHGLAFLIYLIAFTLLTVLAAVHYESTLLRAIAWVAVALPMAGWIERNHFVGWIAPSVVTIAAIFAVHLAAQIYALRHGPAAGVTPSADGRLAKHGWWWSAHESPGDLDGFDVALIHANGIGLFAALHEVLTDSLTTPQLAALAVVLAGFNAGIWASLRRAAAGGVLHWLGVAITLVAIAIWLQFGGPWAVATWATEGAVVFWIASRARREWLRIGAWALFGLAAYRWLQSDIQSTTTAYVVLLNARALTGLYLIGLLYVAAWIQHRQDDASRERRRQERAVVLIAASVITLFVLSTEIVSFWALRENTADSYFAREMMLSASWVTYAAVLVLVGMKYRYAPIRYFAIALFGLALAKVFIFDLQALGGIYRVAGFLVIGLILLIVSFLYQRTRMRDNPGNPAT